MLKLNNAAPVSRLYVDFDYYIPVTITWDSYYKAAVPPIPVVATGNDILVEFSQDPEKESITQITLVTTGRADVDDVSALPSFYVPGAAVRLDKYSDESGCADLHVTAHRDCIDIRLSDQDVSSWTGSWPVIFGCSGIGEVLHMVVAWDKEGRGTAVEGILPR
ncbi:hypothetical protein [Acidipropionibacterium virtanenii]|uniref:Uncharacterized protein n=1 Tax=Acidipropionibacterium virtanenii TaxID=2057246 RepID=A0A344UQ99_9ACTN|nr:hypothetical protein [Acidipropionibacterium virtanenii]AXE37447.1 hypothetical protein JS278_00250 [Acidipropionibacterium virtanenii]